MAKEEKPSFTVTDRRKFTVEGDVRPDVPAQPETPEAEEKSQPKVVEMPRAAAPEPEPPKTTSQGDEIPETPSHADQLAGRNAYDEQTRVIDQQIQRELDARGAGRSASDFQITFEKFIGTLYMTALMQLGLVHEQGGQPHADLMGARQTIDTLALLAEKTKGNLTAAEDAMVTNCLYEVRMAYVEVTNAISRAAQMPPTDPGAGLK